MDQAHPLTPSLVDFETKSSGNDENNLHLPHNRSGTCPRGGDNRGHVPSARPSKFRRKGPRDTPRLVSRVVQILNSPNFTPINKFNIYFDPNYGGVAEAGGSLIRGSVNYYRSHQSDVGSMVHEMAHLIQAYRKCDGWVTEGIADWVRYYHYEPNNKPNKPGPNNRYQEGYGVAAYFLNYINERYNPMIYYINKDCREGTYDPSMFPRLTGKTLDQHWQDMLRSG